MTLHRWQLILFVTLIPLQPIIYRSGVRWFSPERLSNLCLFLSPILWIEPLIWVCLPHLKLIVFKCPFFSFGPGRSDRSLEGLTTVSLTLPRPHPVRLLFSHILLRSISFHSYSAVTPRNPAETWEQIAATEWKGIAAQPVNGSSCLWSLRWGITANKTQAQMQRALNELQLLLYGMLRNAYRKKLVKCYVIYFQILLGCKLRDISPRGTYEAITPRVLGVEYCEMAKMCSLFCLILKCKAVLPKHKLKKMNHTSLKAQVCLLYHLHT